MTKLTMIIDLSRCIGCWTCAVGCKAENDEPIGIWWNRILTNGGKEMDTPSGTYPDISMSYMPINCQHCDNAPCVKVCPVGALRKREDGIVFLDWDRCIGCRYCLIACPYGIPAFNWRPPVQVPGQFTIQDRKPAGSCETGWCCREVHILLPESRRRKPHTCLHRSLPSRRTFLRRPRRPNQ